MDRYRALEVEHNTLQLHQHHHAAMPLALPGVQAVAREEAGGGGGGHRGGPGSSPSPSSGSTAVDQRLRLLRSERDVLEQQVRSLEIKLRAAHDTLGLAGQPHSFLLEELHSHKLRLEAAEAKVRVGCQAGRGGGR